MLRFLFLVEYFGWINKNISCYCPFKECWEWITPRETSTSATLSADIILKKTAILHAKNLKILEIFLVTKIDGGNTVTLLTFTQGLCKPSKSYFSITLVFIVFVVVIFIFNLFKQYFLCWEKVMSCLYGGVMQDN